MSNWWNIVIHASYFSRFGPPPPLDHLWSLAVEEQFYLVWPFLLWLGLRYARGRYRLAGITLAAAALSAIVMALLYQPGVDPTRVYEGTDTRASGLLIGAALAMVWPSRNLRADLAVRRRLLLDGAGVAGLAVIALLIWRTSQYSPFLYLGGNVLLSVSTVGVVAALAHPASWLGPALVAAALARGALLRHIPVALPDHRAHDPGRAEERRPSPADPPGGGDHCRGRPVLALRRRTDPPRRPRAHLGANQIMGVAPESGPRQAVPRRIYRRQRRQRIATGIVSIAALSVLALDGAGLAGVIGSGAEVGSGSQPLTRVPPRRSSSHTPRTSCYSRHLSDTHDEVPQSCVDEH